MADTPGGVDMKKLMTLAAGATALVVLFHATPDGAASSSVAGSRAHAIKSARSATVNKTVRNTVAAAAATAAIVGGVIITSGPATPATTHVSTVGASASVPVAAQPVATTTTAPAPRADSAARVAAAPATPPTTIPDLTGGAGKDTNAPLVPGHWTQSTNGAIYRDPSPGIAAYPTVGANDPAYEAGLDAQLCAVKATFC